MKTSHSKTGTASTARPHGAETAHLGREAGQQRRPLIEEVVYPPGVVPPWKRHAASPYETAVRIDEQEDTSLLEFLFALKRERIWLNRWERWFLTEQLKRRARIPNEFVMHFTDRQRDAIRTMKTKYGGRL